MGTAKASVFKNDLKIDVPSFFYMPTWIKVWDSMFTDGIFSIAEKK